MQFLTLGPLEVRDQHGPVQLGGLKPRAMVAALVLNANRPVSAERLAVALWGEDAPPRAVKTVQVHVSRLRKTLRDQDTIETSPAGYCLRVRPGELDAEQFEQLAEEGRRALKAGDAEAAAESLRASLALWRGPPFADLQGEAFLQTEIARLDERRLGAIETLIEAELARGREAELLADGELQRLVTEHPEREPLAGHLMLALYRRGRQADALDVFREARQRLVEVSGVEPGPALRALQGSILRQDRALLAPQVAALPGELAAATATALEGRDIELAWLRERWETVRAGTGTLVRLRGEPGIGKSRLAAEFATEAHAHGGTVLYVDGGGPAGATLAVLARARSTPGPAVVIIDDADRAPAEVRDALDDFAGAVKGSPVFVLVLDGDSNGSDAEGLRLTPLDVGAVHAIVSRYAPDEEPPSEWLLGASRGVPGAVHELADQWARREAARHAERRIETGARRTAQRRADLRTMERELAADVVVLEAARELGPGEPGVSPMCPFKGLASFQAADAPYFFGRERLVAELVARLVGAPLLGIVGPSGSGKSSVLRAGLLPALAAGVLPGSDRCPQILIRPGAHPVSELRDALARVPDGPLVVAVDQFEETFTVCESPDERTAFIAELSRLARSFEGQGAVALAMRDDFYGRCAEYPGLSRLVADNHVLVGAMREDELRRAVECPAQRAGLIVEPDLVDKLIKDVQGEPGALPLLSTSLLELWQGLEGRRRLRLSAYLESGGVRGAVARLGERSYAALDKPQQAIARRVLLRLAPVDDGGGVERRRVARADLGGDGTAHVVEHLADTRVVTIHTGTVELAHEALLREWPRLRGWIQETQDARRVHRSLTAEARKWVRLNRDDGALLRGALLAEVSEHVELDTLDVQVEREFLEASLERDRRERASRRRRVKIIIGALTAGLVVIGIVAVIAINQRNTAERERNDARSRALVVASTENLEVDPELALRLALEADKTSRTPEAAAALRQAVLGHHQIAALRADPTSAQAAAYSLDGKRIVTGGVEGKARLWDAGSGRLLGVLASEPVELHTVRFSRDGSRIALGYDNGTVTLTDAGLKRQRDVLRVPDVAVERVAFSHDGALLVAALADGTVRVVGVEGGGPARKLVVASEETVINGVDIDAGGRIVTAAGDGSVKLWSADGSHAQTLRRGDGVPERDVIFSPDGKLILAVGEDHLARLWNAVTGKSVADVPGGSRKLMSAAFSRDGQRFAAAGYDGTVRVWSTDGRSQLFALHGQQSRSLEVSFGATSDRLISAGDDGNVRVWDTSGILAIHAPAVLSNAGFSPSGRWIAAGSVEDGTVRVWNAATGTLAGTAPGDGGYTPAYWSPVGDELAIGRDQRSSVQRWLPPDGRPQTAVKLPKDSGINVARFDATGHRLVVAAYMTPDLIVRDLSSGRTWTLGHGPKPVMGAQVSPDGRQVAAGASDGFIYVWDLAHPERPVRKVHAHGGGPLSTLEYSADGRIVTASPDRTASVWDPRGSQPPIVLRGHTDEVNTAVFTRDGQKVLTASADGSVRLWDSHTGAPLATLEDEPDVPLYDVSQGPGGLLATLDDHNVVRVFKCKVCGSLDQVRAMARALHPRPLTAAERQRFVEDLG